MSKLFKLFLFLQLAILVSGCATPRPLIYKSSVTPQFATLTTQKVSIKAVDGSWLLESGGVFKPTKIVDTNWNNFELNMNTTLSADTAEKANYTSLPPRVKNMAYDVAVKVEGKPALMGKMIFFNVRTATNDASAKRMWTISIPDTYIQIARSGNVAAVYQPYRTGTSNNASGQSQMQGLMFLSGAGAQVGVSGVSSDQVSWVLYFSSLPVN